MPPLTMHGVSPPATPQQVLGSSTGCCKMACSCGFSGKTWQVARASTTSQRCFCMKNQWKDPIATQSWVHTIQFTTGFFAGETIDLEDLDMLRFPRICNTVMIFCNYSSSVPSTAGSSNGSRSTSQWKTTCRAGRFCYHDRLRITEARLPAWQLVKSALPIKNKMMCLGILCLFQLVSVLCFLVGVFHVAPTSHLWP